MARPDVYAALGPGRDAGRAQPGVAAQRLPARRPGGLAALCRGRSCRPGWSPTPSTCWPSRSSPTSTSSRPSRPTGTRWSSPRRPARPSCAAGGWSGCSSAIHPPDPRPIEAAAAEAGWALPRTLAVLAIAGEQRSRGRRRRLPAGAISEAIGELTCAVIDDPDGPGTARSDRAGDRQRRRAAGLGTTVDWTQARLSFARARAALELGPTRPRPGAGRRPASAPVSCCCAAIRALAGGAGRRPAGPPGRADRRLAAPADRDAAGLAGRAGAPGPVAERLGIHPQTARYRLGRLRELFGDALDDPDERFWLELALRAQRPDERDRRGLTRRRCGGGCSGLGLGSPARARRRGTSGPERAGGDLVGPGVGDRDLVACPCCGRGTRSSPGRPSSGTSRSWSRTRSSG